jgi:beta-lactam-binding protein with PASTA domain
VTGQPEQEARAALEADAFLVDTVVESELVSDPELAGTVIRQQPRAGTLVARDEPIRLVIGEGVLDG